VKNFGAGLYLRASAPSPPQDRTPTATYKLTEMWGALTPYFCQDIVIHTSGYLDLAFRIDAVWVT